jgi:CRISPR-associated protein Csh2
LPDGTVYATDKAFKYAVKSYLKDVYGKDENIFYFKRLNAEFVPFSLDDAYAAMFPTNKDTKDKNIVAKDLLSCIDIRLFGATFAKKAKAGNIAISIHGPVQINHGVNIWAENNIFSEQIMSPFRNPDEKSEEKQATTLGRQSKLQEGHYLHHFSVNPSNLSEVVKLAGNDAKSLSDEDISKLKESMSRGVTWYDSASKAGSENEALIWITLKEGSKLVLPNLTQLLTMKPEKEDGKVVLDCEKLKTKLAEVKAEIESVEIAYNNNSIKLENEPENININLL